MVLELVAALDALGVPPQDGTIAADLRQLVAQLVMKMCDETLGLGDMRRSFVVLPGVRNEDVPGMICRCGCH